MTKAAEKKQKAADQSHHLLPTHYKHFLLNFRAIEVISNAYSSARVIIPLPPSKGDNQLKYYI
ncbi:hypothetical protein EFA69_01605 [Rufibacter immobilis]|uniref:Uncharacterized protein n=1 Tax=Rufibacter immobilis TaxID=1348778 RepID=A0A3M9N5S3_9BACT|nr:hypothetical protein EFA69_01605 [Rufibacter immobilis]